MMLTRFADWPSRLSSFLQDHRTKQFHFGSWDCCLFACDAIHSMTGVDPAASLRGRYSTRRTAYSQIKEQFGARSIREVSDAITANLAMPEIKPVRASRGDLVLIRRPLDHSLGIVALNGAQILVVAEHGFGLLDLTYAVKAWSV